MTLNKPQASTHPKVLERLGPVPHPAYKVREHEATKAVIVLIEHNNCTLPLWWCGNTLQGWHTGAPIPREMMLAALAVATRLGTRLKC